MRPEILVSEGNREQEVERWIPSEEVGGDEEELVKLFSPISSENFPRPMFLACARMGYV
ncbi:hypothetical protein [Floridanema aerugineum]|uniref:Uncharacterized protein n=1 Tax=Floridaenema aerugineum BLCC-F46 TaxID=3153654 RepID=A0ABV4XEF3_9CYAN